jgi:hypothetical protein
MQKLAYLESLVSVVGVLPVKYGKKGTKKWLLDTVSEKVKAEWLGLDKDEVVQLKTSSVIQFPSPPSKEMTNHL